MFWYIQAVLTQPGVAASSNYRRFSFRQPWTHYTPQKPKGMWPCHRASSTSAGEGEKKKRRVKVSKRCCYLLKFPFYSVSSAGRWKREAWAFWHRRPEMDLEALWWTGLRKVRNTSHTCFIHSKKPRAPAGRCAQSSALELPRSRWMNGHAHEWVSGACKKKEKKKEKKL